LKPFIKIESLPEKTSKNRFFEREQDKKPKWEIPKAEPVVVELNAADSAQLVQVIGIGPFFAKVIIEHREKLGGYRSKNQVLEVYGMDSTKFERIEDQLIVDSLSLAQINVNTATFKELLRHPYLNYNQTKAIVNYREQHGLFKSVSELQKIHLVKGETYRKIAPYLEVP
jgi:competence ComEA-like helix-hairpin-helix protein